MLHTEWIVPIQATSPLKSALRKGRIEAIMFAGRRTRLPRHPAWHTSFYIKEHFVVGLILENGPWRLCIILLQPVVDRCDLPMPLLQGDVPVPVLVMKGDRILSTVVQAGASLVRLRNTAGSQDT